MYNFTKKMKHMEKSAFPRYRRRTGKTLALVLTLAVVLTASLSAQTEEESDSAAVSVSATAEFGFVKSLYHDIQIGEEGYRFDYVDEGGQEILLPYKRFEVEGLLGGGHEISFLYQPLTLQTRTRVDKDGGIKIDDVLFADDTPLDLQYGFDFYRGTYRYRFADSNGWKVSAGAGLQLRNASIIFDGYEKNPEVNGDFKEARVVTQDLGPVPVLSFALRRGGSEGSKKSKGVFLEASLDGFYAPVKYLNLDNVDVIGWLYDAALRLGVPAGNYGEAYVSIRFLGGGAEGTAGDRSRWTQSISDPRYTWNNLNLAVLSLGVRLR